jgi:hypothetical protein
MKFATIIERNKEHPAIYHGIVTSRDYNTGSFEFAFRMGDRNYTWSCQEDYWILIL